MILRFLRPIASRFSVLLASLVGAGTISAQTATPLNITTLAGQAGQRQATNGTGAAARFYAPSGIVIDRAGNLIVVDAANNFVRQVTPAGAVTTYAGQPIDLESRPINTGSADGPVASASFNFGTSASAGGPWGPPIFTIVGGFSAGIDGSGNIYLADLLNNTVRKITPEGIVSTLAGLAGNDGAIDATGNAARFRSPTGVAADSAGNVYVADSGNNLIRKITPAGVVTTLAGLARAAGTTDGTGAAARFNNPSAVAIDSSGNIYVTDSGNHTIRKVTSTGVVTTFAGTPGASGASDGSATQARFNTPTAIAVDGSGNVYVTDIGSHTVRFITSAGRVSTIAGQTGSRAAADGIGNAARFNEPSGLAVDSAGTVYISDTQNNTIRKGVPAGGTVPVVQITQQPVRRFVNVGRSVTLVVVASATPAATYQWYRGGAAINGATAATFTISNVQNSDAGLYTVVVTSGTVSATSAAAELSVFPATTNIPPVIIVSQPQDATVRVGFPVTLTVEASAETTATYQWRKETTPIPGATSPNFTINSAQASDGGNYSVVIADGSFSVTSNPAVLTVDTSGTPPSAPLITTQPLTQTINAGSNVSFTVSASGNPAPTFQWRRDGALIFNGATPSGASINGATTATLTITGATAGEAGAYSVLATNSVGAVTSNAAALTVNTPVVTASRIINLSILTSVGAGGDSFTMGYVVGGESTTGAKPLVIRAAGPSLGALGVPGTLDDPKIELFAGSTAGATNDNWGGSANVAAAMAAVGAFPFINATSRDSAVAVNVTTRDNSVKVSAAGSGTGTVLAEIYDATPSDAVTPATPRLLNVSLLKNIGTSVSAGFVIRGPTAKKVLIRAIGPTLGTAFGMTGVVANPQLTLFGANQTRVGENDNWGGTTELSTAFTSVGAFALPAGSQDAALLATLNPGDYSVVVTGVASTTGIALIEVYDVP